MVETHQAMAPARPFQRGLQHCQLVIPQQAMCGAVHRRVEHHNTSGADIGYRLYQLRRHFGHDPGLIMVARQPTAWYAKRRSQLTKSFIRSNAGILGQIARAQQQVDKRLLAPHLGYHMAQTFTGLEAQRAAGRVGEKMGVCQLHHMYWARVVCMHVSERLPVRGHRPGSDSAIHRGTG